MNGRRLCNVAEPSDQFFSGRLQSGRLVDTFTAAWVGAWLNVKRSCVGLEMVQQEQRLPKGFLLARRAPQLWEESLAPTHMRGPRFLALKVARPACAGGPFQRRAASGAVEGVCPNLKTETGGARLMVSLPLPRVLRSRVGSAACTALRVR